MTHRYSMKLVTYMLCTLAILASARIAWATNYYINCSASSNGSGTQNSPWNSLPNSHQFSAGDIINFMRGTTCYGEFQPNGQGGSTSPITVTAYGSGTLPVIDGQSNWAVIYLWNQSYWTIQNIELLHGQYWGLLAQAANNATVTGLTVTNVVATGATYASTSRGDSGEIALVADGTDSATISNVNISGVAAGNTTTSDGIYVAAGNSTSMTGAKGINVSIQNSNVSSVYGDGILVADANNVLISANVVAESGLCPSCGSSTPGPIWVWNCTNAVMSWNESYSNKSWGATDGGGMDIDYFNKNVTAEYNYLHDNKGYCVSVLGAENETTVNSIVRFNICINNNNSVGASNDGDFLLYTWDGGTLNGVQIYNNTSYWDSSLANNDEFEDVATFTGSNPSFFKNNLIYSPLQYVGMVNASSPISLSNNLYYSSASSPQYWFGYNGTWWSSFSQYQSGSGQDGNSKSSNPLLGDPGYDVDLLWPTTQYEPQSGSPAIGAGVNVCTGISGCSMGSYDFLGKALPSRLWIGAIQE